MIFFNHDNYLFFLKKLKRHVLPHADILAWCLMPNHFHLMVYVNQVLVSVNTDGVPPGVTDGVTPSHPVSNTHSKLKVISFNDNIGILLRSYSRAVNK